MRHISSLFGRFGAAVLLLLPVLGWGQISITPGGAAVTQNFNAIGGTATATLPANWRADKNNSSVRTVGTYAAAVTATEQAGGANPSAPSTNGIYNFTSATASDQAIGGLSSNSNSKSVNLYSPKLTNAGAGSVSGFTVSYNVEKYRNGSNAAGFTIQLYYSTNGTSWTSAGSNFTTSFAADADILGYTTAPAVTTAVTSQPLSVPVAAGTDIYFAWNYSVTSGTTTSNAQALGVDDISLSPLAASTPTLAVVPASLTGFSYQQGAGPSAPQSYALSGTNLTAGPITVTAPTNYEVSLGAGGTGTYTASVSVTYTVPTLASTTVYVRLKSGLTVGSYTGGNVTNAGGGATTQNVAVSGSVTPTLTEVLLPQYLSGGVSGSNTNRVPYAFLATLSNLTASATYRYFTQAIANGQGATTANAKGNTIFINPSGNFAINTATPDLSTAGRYSTFTASGTGTYTGWFGLEPSGSAIFDNGNLVQPVVVLNDGAGGTVANVLATSSTVTAAALGAAATNATGLYGTTAAPAKNFVLSYDNTAGTGRPLYAGFVESDGAGETTANSYAAFYGTNVDGTAGRYGLLTPNTNANGIQRLEQRALADGSLVCANTDADGTWPSGTNTVNPTGGTTALVLTVTDAPLAALGAATLGSTSGIVGDAVTITGSNFVAGGTTVSFNGTAATVSSVNAAGTSLSTTVPGGASTGTVLVNTASTCSTAQSAGTYTVNATATPTLVATPTTLSGFTYVTGSGPSAEQTYALSGSGLTAGPITVTAPANYEVSLTTGTGYAASVSVPYTVPTLGATTIYVRLKSGLAANTYTGNVTNVGGGASLNVPVSGSVTAPVPVVTVNPTSLAVGTVAVNTPGTISTYTVSGSNLGSTPISITAPANVELSLNGFVTSASPTLSLAPTAGSVGNTTVSVRIAATATTGSVGTPITNTSGSASQPVAVTGTVAAGSAPCFPTEGFETAIPPAGWPAATGVVRSTTASDVKNGVAAASFTGNNGTLTTPAVANPTAVSFYLGASSSTTTAKKFLVKVSTTSSTGPYTTLRTYDAGGATGGDEALPPGVVSYNLYNVDLSAYNSFGAVYIQFEKVSGTPSQFRLDDVTVTCGAAAPTFTLATGTVSPTTYCINQGSNTAITVPYTVSGGSFGTGNVFTAYLSDKTGSFASETTLANPVNGVTSGSITANLPAGTPTGTGYRVRVKASTPATTAADNGTNLSVGNSLDNEVAAKTATPDNGQVALTFTQPATCVTGLIITAKLTTLGTKPLVGTPYNANPAFGGPGSTDLGGGQFVVYNNASLAPGASGTVTVTGLTNGSLYQFQFFTTGGNGYSNGSSASARPVAPATVTEVLVPQYLSARSSSGAHATRLPYVWRVQLSNLAANATYSYYTAATASTDAPNYGGAGIPLEVQSLPFKRGTGPNFGGLGSSFLTDGTGSYTGWFGLEATADVRFAPAAQLFPTVVINDGQGGTTVSQALRTTNTVTALLLATGAGNATGVQGSSFGTAGNFVLTYDNAAPGSATNRPLTSTWVESDGNANAAGTNGYATFYASNVDGVASAYGLLTPNTNASGIRQVEQRALADGSLVGCPATSANGTWPGGANTVNPTGGTTALVLTTGDTPFQPATVTGLSPASPSTVQQNATLTITGSNFTTGPRPTVTFTGGATAVAATVNALGTSLTVTVPAGAQSGTVSVTAGCGTAVPSAATVTVVPLVFYTVTGATDLSLLASFTANADGSVGVAPTSFATANQVFNVLGTGRSFASSWTVSGTNSKVVIASGAELVIPATATFTGTLDQAATSTLSIANAVVSGIVQGVQDATSTINLAQTGGVYTVPTALAYKNLSLTGGQKRIAGDNTTPLVVSGNLTFDNTAISGAFVNAAGSPGNYPTFKFGGDFTQLAGTTYDATRSVVLQPSNLTTVQSLNANGGTIALYDVFTPTSGTFAGFRLTGTGSVLQVGNTFDGGFALDNGTPLALDAGTTLRLTGGARFFSTASGTLKPSAGANIEINRSTDGVAAIGILPLATGFTTVNNFTLNATAPTATNNALTLGNDLTVAGTLALTAGTLAVGTNVLVLNGPLTAGTGTLTGGTSSDLTVGGTGALASLSFASGARLLNNLTLSRAGATLALGTPLTVDNTLTLTNGIIATSATTLLTLTRTGTAAVSGGSASSYVSGPLARATATGAATVRFPIGKGTDYRPLTLNTAAQSATRTYTAEQFNSTARTDGVSGGLTRVSATRYFSLNPAVASGTFSGTVTLSFGADDLVNYPQDASFVMAKRPTGGGTWTNIGRTSATGANVSTPGTYAAGDLTSGVFTTFSDFSLASTAPASNNAAGTVNPLPVELTRFAAQREKGKTAVALAWATASEKNSAYFEVQRSLNGETFVTIATVAAQGSAAQPSAYAAPDPAAPAAQLYYRLRQVDADGSAAFSQVVVVAPVSGSMAVTLYPNPARETVRFQAVERAEYRVLNVLGQPVLQGTVEAGAATVPVAKLAAGAYYLELQSAAGRTVRKFVKE